MATFGITPVTGYPLPPSDAFPEFIQFQAFGVNLGGPDADTVNFSDFMRATRGTGENANVVTVKGAELFTPLIAQMGYHNTDSGTVVSVAYQSADALIFDPEDVTLNDFTPGGTPQATFVRSGVYRVRITHRISGTAMLEGLNVKTSAIGTGFTVVNQYFFDLTPYSGSGGYTGELVQEFSQTVGPVNAGDTVSFETVLTSITGGAVDILDLTLEVELQGFG